MFKHERLLTTQTSMALALMFVFGVLGSFPYTNALAQAQSNPSNKAATIPEKKPDGTWEGLSPRQQMILTPLEEDWDYMQPDIRRKWIQIANLYPKMSEADQQRLQSRMNGWSKLSQKDRRLARENYLSSLKFPSEKKAEAWNAYQKLSDEQKKKLADAEVKKKKPTAASAPTLQQHPIIQQSNLAPTLPSAAPPPPAANPEATATPASETPDRSPSDS